MFLAVNLGIIVYFPGTITCHTSTPEFLSMKEAHEKFGGSSLEIMVRAAKAC